MCDFPGSGRATAIFPPSASGPCAMDCAVGAKARRRFVRSNGLKFDWHNTNQTPSFTMPAKAKVAAPVAAAAAPALPPVSPKGAAKPKVAKVRCFPPLAFTVFFRAQI
jgi:hypothetical protein